MYKSRQNIRAVAAVVFVAAVLFSPVAHGAGKMEPLYNIKEATELKPHTFDTGESTSLSLFPVPHG